MTVQVQLDAASAELTKSGAVVGTLWLDIDGMPFPEQGWHDFPAPVLTWWIESLRGLVSRQSDSTILRFMDGPFEVSLDRTGRVTTARFLHLGIPVIPETEMEPNKLLASALDHAFKLLSDLGERGLKSSDLDDLRRAAASCSSL